MKKLLKKFSRLRFRDIVNPVKWWHYVKGNILGQFVKKHIIEQLMWRLLSCPQCVEEGMCTHCGCDIPQKMYILDETCSNGEWGPVMAEEDWESYKRKHNIKFIIKSNFN